ncbi:ATP-binding cassette domain-containing protein, partial [Dehalococcoidia bacterium]|nr:ATP-binding cassette domain-containing protein [Dehalococcoidia bacterium]
METLLNVRNISKQFGKNTVVDQVSFDVHKGEILGVLGPNGAGKTTVIRSIMDIIRPDS